MTIDFDSAGQDAADSEAESMVVHNSGDAGIGDLASDIDFETDTEIDSDPLLGHRAQTRLISRSHSASDLMKDQGDSTTATEPPRRNSSGECPQSLFDSGTPSPKPSHNVLLSDLDLSRYCKGPQHRLSVTPTSGVLQLSPVNVQHWRCTPQPVKEDSGDGSNFSAILHTTAEKVLEKLKSRQLDLGGGITGGQRFQKRLSLGLQPAVPRKLQPLQRDDGKTPRSDVDLRSVSGDGDLGPFSAA